MPSRARSVAARRPKISPSYSASIDEQPGRSRYLAPCQSGRRSASTTAPAPPPLPPPPWSAPSNQSERRIACRLELLATTAVLSVPCEPRPGQQRAADGRRQESSR
eukprot:scaffold170837_cov33-Tisochrysis_lutea.AAC.1